MHVELDELTQCPSYSTKNDPTAGSVRPLSTNDALPGMARAYGEATHSLPMPGLSGKANGPVGKS